ncbi:MAG: hypothetical protein IPP57_19215 [Candidatus Obscuribacter sp.]|nr:hypothetical protein [Candidatus Obscuribacter sp.]
MILSLGKRTTQESVEKVVRRLLENGLESQVVVSGDITLVVVTSDAEAIAGHFFSQLEGVEKVVKLTNRTPLAADSCAVVNIGKIDGPRGRLSIGGGQPVVIAGPCSVESKEHIFKLLKLSATLALRQSEAALQTAYFTIRLSGTGAGWSQVYG